VGKEGESGVQSVGSLLTGVFSGVDQKLRALGGTGEEWHHLTTSEGEVLHLEIAMLMMGIKVFVSDIIPATIDYDQPLVETIRNSGYCTAIGDIVEICRVDDSGQIPVELKLYYFNRDIGRGEIKKIVRLYGFEVSPIEDLVWLGKNYPDFQREFPIAALGSVAVRSCDGSIAIPCLDTCASERLLYLRERCVSQTRYLARRIIVPAA